VVAPSRDRQPLDGFLTEFLAHFPAGVRIVSVLSIYAVVGECALNVSGCHRKTLV
jgi:hypothetical protein